VENAEKHVARNNFRFLARVASRFVLGLLAVGAFFFLTAGSLDYVNGWIFVGTFAALMLPVLIYLAAKDPSLLEKRMRTKEGERPQRRLIFASLALNLTLFGLPGIDWRFGWSHVPPWLVSAALVAMLGSFAFYVAVMLANTYASRVVEVQESQKVIDSGPYAHVRHPMYLAIAVINPSAALVLGSYWALVPAAIYPFLIAARIRGEERLLERELPGYAEYMGKVRWRLVPGLW
jgi:protein-S-isoprenylcysteine O-methyltransferase Ste14